MKYVPRETTPRIAKAGERTGTSCPICGDSVLRQDVPGVGGRTATRLVCSKRGCPWQGREA